MGLTIAKQVVEMYKGRMWVESEIGKGATFWVALPKDSTTVMEED